MFNLTSIIRSNKNLVVTGLVAASFAFGSVSAQAAEFTTNDIVVAVEKNITAASQDMLANAKQDFILSLKEQISQQAFDINEQTDTVKNDVTAPVLVSQQTEAK
jgi:hypothetical protein